MALKVGQRINIYKIVANEKNYKSPCMQIMGNLRPGIKDGRGVSIYCYNNCRPGRWNTFYMFQREVKLVGCMIIKSIK